MERKLSKSSLNPDINEYTISGIVVFAFLFILCAYLPGFADDVNCWRRWAVHIHEHGLSNIYDSDSNYLPVYHYILWFYGKICGTKEAIESNVFVLKWITLLIEAVGFVYVYKWLGNKQALISILLLGLLNIGASYNNIVWGQVDGILATLIFVSIYYAYAGRLAQAGVWFTVGILFKLQAICFLPLWALLCLYHIFTKRSVRGAIILLSSVVLTAALILLPFLLKNGGMAQVLAIYTGYVDSVPKLALGAFNFWSWVKDDYLGNYSDTEVWFGGLQYKSAGFLMFFLSGFLALLPLMVNMAKRLFDKKEINNEINMQTILLTGALSCLVFYYFNTQIHERYSHPAFIFLLAYAFFSRDFIPYILFTLAYFLNVEALLHNMRLTNYNTVIFNQKFVSGLYGMSIIYVFIRLYRVSFANKNRRDPKLL
jgi:Gpi18-like mannosyltransferase